MIPDGSLGTPDPCASSEPAADGRARMNARDRPGTRCARHVIEAGKGLSFTAASGDDAARLLHPLSWVCAGF